MRKSSNESKRSLHPRQQTYLFILNIFYADFASSEMKNPNSNALCVGWKTTYMPKTAMISLAATGPRTNQPLSQHSFMLIKLSARNHHPGMLKNSNEVWEHNCHHPKWLWAESSSLKFLKYFPRRPVCSLIVKFSLLVHRFHTVHREAVRDRSIWQLSGVGKVVVLCVCVCVCLSLSRVCERERGCWVRLAN